MKTIVVKFFFMLRLLLILSVLGFSACSTTGYEEATPYSPYSPYMGGRYWRDYHPWAWGGPWYGAPYGWGAYAHEFDDGFEGGEEEEEREHGRDRD